MTEDEFAGALYPRVRLLAKHFSGCVYRTIPSDDLTQTGMIGALKLWRRGYDRRTCITAARRDMIDQIRSELHRGKSKFCSLDFKAPGQDEPIAISHEPRYVERLDREIDARRACDLLLRDPECDVVMPWINGQSLFSIGQDRGVSETLIFQIKKRVIARIRLRMEKPGCTSTSR